MSTTTVRRLPVGADLQADGGTDFRVWAPSRKSVDVAIDDRFWPLQKSADGYFSGQIASAVAGARYRYRLDGGDAFPDPASRFQPEGPHGPSEIVDPQSFRWTDAAWKGLPLEGQVIYELHLGTFSREGSWSAATQELDELAEFGASVIEVMPVADFAGNFGWGYDGVNLFAPSHLYGKPDDMRAFVDRAHALGIAVILDVVYNHFGADGNYLGQYSRHYFSDRYKTDWGEAIAYDEPTSSPVREYFKANAAYWIDEFHLDGLRLDATQNIYDQSTPHILAEITDQVRSAAKGRHTIVVAENEPQLAKLIRPKEAGGFGMDALWNDDFHHSAMVAVTGQSEAYYTDYQGTPQEFISALKHGYLYQGQWYKWQRQCRGTSTRGLPPSGFVTFIENHDQVANSATGQRLHQLTSPGLFRAMSALYLLGPSTPMIFQGQEFASSAPFLFFADMPDCLHSAVREGRREFLRQFQSLKSEDMAGILADPCSTAVFESCKLNFEERETHQWCYAMYRDLLRLRREDRVLRQQGAEGFDGAVLSTHAFVLRFFCDALDDRLLVVNLGGALHLQPAPEPLLAPPDGSDWSLVFSSEDPKYGGRGTGPVDSEDNWHLPGNAAVLLKPISPKLRKTSQEVGQ